MLVHIDFLPIYRYAENEIQPTKKEVKLVSRDYARAHFPDSPVTKATIQLVDGSHLLQKDSKIRLHEMSVKGIRFSSEIDFSIGDHIIMNIRLFAPTNHIFGKVVWKKQAHDTNTFTYGILIIMSDYDYYQFMHSYDTYIKNKQHPMH